MTPYVFEDRTEIFKPGAYVTCTPQVKAALLDDEQTSYDLWVTIDWLARECGWPIQISTVNKAQAYLAPLSSFMAKPDEFEENNDKREQFCACLGEFGLVTKIGLGGSWWSDRNRDAIKLGDGAGALDGIDPIDVFELPGTVGEWVMFEVSTL